MSPHEFTVITSADDSRLSDYVGLRSPRLRQRVELEGGYCIVEGVLQFERLLRLGTWRVRSLLVSPKLGERLRPILDEVTPVGSFPMYVTDEKVFRAVAGYDIHRGAVASVERQPPWPTDPGELLGPAEVRRIAVLEGVNDHENLGAVFRNASAFGIDAVLLDVTTADPLYRRSVRVSMGHVLAVPHARYASLDNIAQAGFTTVALTPAADAQDIQEFAASIPVDIRLAVLLGAEGPGLSPETLAAADHRIRIPMASGVDSINVATAGALAFHALRPPTS